MSEYVFLYVLLQRNINYYLKLVFSGGGFTIQKLGGINVHGEILRPLDVV